MTILYKFKTLRLYIIYCFCHILEEMIFKGFLLNSLSFKLEISPVFIKKVFRTRKIPGNIRNWVFAKAVIEVIRQGALKEGKISRKSMGGRSR